MKNPYHEHFENRHLRFAHENTGQITNFTKLSMIQVLEPRSQATAKRLSTKDARCKVHGKKLVYGQREDAEDTMQEVLLKSVPHLPKFDSPRALVVWLYKVAKNRCLMSRRRSNFAPQPDLFLAELVPDRKELEQLSTSDRINPEAFAIRRVRPSGIGYWQGLLDFWVPTSRRQGGMCVAIRACGEDYVRYREPVPMFVPHLGKIRTLAEIAKTDSGSRAA